MSILGELHELNNRLARIRERAVEDEAAEAQEHFEEIDGVTVGLKFFYSDRRHTRRNVTIDGYPFALEYESVPWNFLQSITVTYWVWTDLPLEWVQELIAAVNPVGKLRPMEEFYPMEFGPARWNAHATELQDVIALYKVWAPKYKPL